MRATLRSGFFALTAFMCTCVQPANGQWATIADSLNRNRLSGVATLQGSALAGSYAGLWQLWYKPHRSGTFSWFDDSREWLGMDKAGHSATSYIVAENAHRLNRWTGMNDLHALLWSVSATQLYLLGIEVQDGLSAGWGFSTWDVAANAAGGALYAGQHLMWGQQRIRLKWTYAPSGLSSLPGREGERARDIFGRSWTTQWLKDYNGHTYWLSMNIWSLTGQPFGFPRWLNIALGYGANNMLGARGNVWYLNGDPTALYHSALQRERKLLLSFDIDLDRVPLPRWMMWLRPVTRAVKFPLPAIEWNSAQGMRFWGMYF